MIPHVILAAALALAPVGAACQPADGLVYAHDDGKAVAAAVAKARDSLPIFWRKFEGRERTPGYDAFMLKVELPAAKIGSEAIWIGIVSHAGNRIEGIVTEDALYIPGLKGGARVQVDPATVIDWSYNKDDKIYGQFTTRALLSDATPAQRAEALAALAPMPIETEGR